jgi:DNA modification methylase
MKDDRLTVLEGDCRETLKTLPDGSVHCCVTSPPYFGLRDYGNGEQIGLEQSPDDYVAEMVAVFREVRRTLRDDGTTWLNLGDSYGAVGGDTWSGFNARYSGTGLNGGKQAASGENARMAGSRKVSTGLRPKNLIGIPWRVAFALQADGWWLRQEIIWCLSGGTWVYARTKKGDMPMMLRDAARLNPSTVRLWNGEKWTQVLGWSRSSRNADELELVLRSGERISCTPNHQFPTGRGLLRADQIQEGDILTRAGLPQPDAAKNPKHIGDDAAWFAGLYLAEGSMSGDTIQIAGHAMQTDRLERVKAIAEAYGGTVTVSIDGNRQSIRVYGKVLVSLLSELVSGRTAKDKCLASVCWRYTNGFLRSMLDGYLSGDGHYDSENDRWRIAFTRNYNLERDLRTLSARLGFKMRLSPCFVDGFGKRWPAFRGEIRFTRSGHHNEKCMEEVVEIRKSRCREVYDVGVEDEPHLFALASGILTHNSKPNPMPESVTDRCTKSHEHIFLLAKSERYYFDADAIKEESVTFGNEPLRDKSKEAYGAAYGVVTSPMSSGERFWTREKRNKRSVWTVPTAPYKGAHFATFPPALIEPCILAGCPRGGTVLDPFGGSGTTAQVAINHGRKAILCELNPEYIKLIHQRCEWSLNDLFSMQEFNLL